MHVRVLRMHTAGAAGGGVRAELLQLTLALTLTLTPTLTVAPTLTRGLAMTHSWGCRRRRSC